MATTKWILDPTHSELGFKVKHLMITNVSGLIRDFSAEVETNGTDFATSRITLTAAMDSISTNNEQRDAHLRNADFFEVDKYPEMKFSSTKVVKTGNDSFDVYGDLTLKGIAKPVKLQVESSDVVKDPWGNERSGFVISGKIKRSEWGINFNSVLETGGIALSDEVRINSEIQLVKQAEKVAA